MIVCATTPDWDHGATLSDSSQSRGGGAEGSRAEGNGLRGLSHVAAKLSAASRIILLPIMVFIASFFVRFSGSSHAASMA